MSAEGDPRGPGAMSAACSKLRTTQVPRRSSPLPRWDFYSPFQELNTMTLIGPCLRSRAQLRLSSTDYALWPSLCSLSGSDQRSKQLRRERLLRNADLEMIPAPLLCHFMVTRSLYTYNGG